MTVIYASEYILAPLCDLRASVVKLFFATLGEVGY